MSIRLFLLGLAFAILGCAPPLVGWPSFHGEPSGRGFRDVKSGFALSPAWVSPPLNIAGSSPVIGMDAAGVETVYVGTADGRLVALAAETGGLLWQCVLSAPGGGESVVSAPAAEDAVWVITTAATAPGSLRSTLHKVNRQGLRRWSFPFPDGGFSTGAPRVFRHANQMLVVFAATVSSPGGLRSELLVLRDEGAAGELLDRRSLGACPAAGGGAGAGGELERAWSRLVSPPGVYGERAPETWFDPTPAVVTGRPKPLIAVVDNLCRIGAFEWGDQGLAALWQVPHPGEKHSSPAVLPNRLMVFGDRSGRVIAYDAETGVKVWEVPTGAPVLASPAAAGPAVFVVSGSRLLALHADNGETVMQSGAPQRLALPAATLSSPAATAQRVYVSAGEMLTVSHDFKVRSQNTGFSGNGLSSPAVGRDGSLYVVARDGSVWKYRGAQ